MSLLSFALDLFGVKEDILTREEAALAFMERDVTFSWRPVVVELAQESELVAPPSAVREVSSD